MSNWRDPYASSGKALRNIIILFILLGMALVLLRPMTSRAQSPEPFWAPLNTIVGVLYISNGQDLTTEFGAILFAPDSSTGTLLVKDGLGNYVPAGEVTITYWVEPDSK